MAGKDKKGGCVMNPDSRARIENGTTLVFNTALTVELAILAHGPVLGREKAKKFAAKMNSLADFEPYLTMLSLHADFGGDRLAQALQIVRLIGNAAGEEMYRQDYSDDWEILVQAFQSGLMSGEPASRSADGMLEDLFHECGKHADCIVSTTLPPDFEDAPKEAVTKLIGIIVDAFADGMEEVLL
jgi:hypothetical protein